LLSRYKSGPLPKAFKILPTLSQWPLLLSITNPGSWTPHALLAATKIFASNLDPKQSQKFYRDILSDRVREEIFMNKKLSVQSYFALKKALYKPAAFFKGLLFPLCEVS
jgi:essential nuclear protein 1